MKDPSSVIYTSFLSKLATLTYDSKTVPVYASRSEVDKGNYVLLDTLSFVDAIDESAFGSDCEMRIEIRCGPYFQQGYNDMVFAISSSLMQLTVKQDFTVSGFSIDVNPYIISSRNYEERDVDEKGIFKIKEIILGFHVEED